MILDRGHLNEEEAKNIFFQIMQAIHYCHSNKICHRDLKPENFLLLTKEPNSPIKVIDFGLSTIFKETPTSKINKKSTSMTTKAGTVIKQITNKLNLLDI
jgi:calcium-dependent protein kinase